MGMNRTLDTGNGAMSIPFVPNRPYARITNILYHGSAVGGSGDLTVTKISSKGTEYNTLILKKDMTSLQDFAEGEMDIPLMHGDELIIEWANAGGVTWGIEVYYNTEG